MLVCHVDLHGQPSLIICRKLQQTKLLAMMLQNMAHVVFNPKTVSQLTCAGINCQYIHKGNRIRAKIAYESL